MLMFLGGVAALIGAISAIAAGNFPPHTSQLERWGGALLLSGVALIALGFPFV